VAAHEAIYDAHETPPVKWSGLAGGAVRDGRKHSK
jgi:hypothetical protein